MLGNHADTDEGREMSTEHPESFKRRVYIGEMDTGHATRALVHVDITWTAAGERDEHGNEPTDTGSLSISGDAKRPRARDIDQGGQMQTAIRDMPAEDLAISEEHRDALVGLWNAYHLNTLTAGCEHQRAMGWHAAHAYTGSPTTDAGRAYDYALRILDGLSETIPPRPACAVCRGLSGPDAPCYSCEGGMATEHAYRLRETKTELRRRLELELRDDVSRPCPVCGYRYGSAWLKLPVPADVVLFLRDTLGRPVEVETATA